MGLVGILLLMPSTTGAAPAMHADGLVAIPTAYVLPHGVFAVGGGVALDGSPELSRHETLLKLDFGILDRFVVHLNGLYGTGQSALFLDGKILLFKEIEAWPAFVLGVEHVGEAAPADAVDLAYPRGSIYVALSKRWMLPAIHEIRTHGGWGNGYYRRKGTPGDSLRGVFFGIQKRWDSRLLKGTTDWSVEFDTWGWHVGWRYHLDSGAEIQVGFRSIGSQDWSSWLGVTWTNQQLQRRVAEAERLARAAARLAITGSKSSSTEPKPSSE